MPAYREKTAAAGSYLSGSPDGSRPGVFYNTGHGHLGWTLSAATAEIIAAQIEAELSPT